ncbi:MAG: hypothetical protein AB7S50_00135 [Bacteroidales bacterium]
MKKLFILLFVLAGCSTVQNTVQKYSPITTEKFLEKPFGFEESIHNFSSKENPSFKVQKLLRKNTHYPEKTDTIYDFRYKKSQIFFYKTYTGKEFLLAGKILNSQIELVNGIKVGLPKSVFTDRFSENLTFTGDSLQLISEGTKYTFIFKKDKLYRINIDNYFD